MRAFTFFERVLSLYGLIWFLASISLIVANIGYNMSKTEMLVAIAVAFGYATVRDVIDKRLEEDRISDD